MADLLARSPLNLVSVRDRARLRELHLTEALAVGRALQPGVGETWLDLGTGGGLPGLVLAIAYPATHWVLIDATTKKVAAVAEIASRLGLPNVTTRSGRA